MSDRWRENYLTLKVKHANLEEDMERLTSTVYRYVVNDSHGKPILSLPTLPTLEEAQKWKDKGYEVFPTYAGPKL